MGNRFKHKAIKLLEKKEKTLGVQGKAEFLDLTLTAWYTKGKPEK